MKKTIELPMAIAAWGTTAFSTTLKTELEQLKPEALPLQEGVVHGSYVSGDRFDIMIIGLSETDNLIHVKAGVHYQSIIAGCSCADDPTPVDELNEYCQLAIVLDKSANTAKITLLEN